MEVDTLVLLTASLTTADLSLVRRRTDPAAHGEYSSNTLYEL